MREVSGVEFPESADAVDDHPIVELKAAKNAEAAQRFVALVRSDQGQKVLTDAGFLKP
jgi:molybdate transport system substrate-binding protein